jgi:NAD(P) transhydrogenase
MSLVSGKRIAADMVMYSAGRQDVTEELNLQKAGLVADPRGRTTVDGQYRTAVPHIELQPIGIYTVPEISYCGKTEAELTQSAVPYEVGMPATVSSPAARSSVTRTGC